MREARALAAHGCTESSDSASSTMRAFLRAGANAERRLVVKMEAGRVYVLSASQETHSELADLGGRARDFGLSYLDTDGTVHVQIAVQNHLALVSLLRVIALGAAAGATLSNDHWRMTLRHTRGAFVASVWHASRAHAAGLRMLGFRESRNRSWQRLLDGGLFARARMLTRILHACLGADVQVDAVLTPPNLAAPLNPEVDAPIDESSDRRST